jgi:WD40 repeat protein
MYWQGCIVTGCMDSRIRVFDSVGNPISMGEGHQKGIISFSWTRSYLQLISGSWDGTAKIWEFNTTVPGLIAIVCIRTFGPHENGVNVLGLNDDITVTTSTGESVNEKPANFQIRFWNNMTGQQTRTSLRDHSGPIRSIARVPGLSYRVFCCETSQALIILNHLKA